MIDRSTEVDPRQLVNRMGRVAHHLLAAAAPVRFTVAMSEADRHALYALRYAVVVDEGWIDPAAVPQGMERDAHDERAVHLIGWDDDVMAATARLVFPSPGERLPTEEAFGLRVAPAGEVVDLGRGVVARPYRGRGHATFVGLLAAAWLKARAQGFVRLCGTSAPSMLPHYRAMGFHVDVLGGSRGGWGGERGPSVMGGTRGSAPALEELAARTSASATDHGRITPSGVTSSSTTTGTLRSTRA
jgi:predicted GNAT family N-acyltransferase